MIGENYIRTGFVWKYIIKKCYKWSIFITVTTACCFLLVKKYFLLKMTLLSWFSYYKCCSEIIYWNLFYFQSTYVSHSVHFWHPWFCCDKHGVCGRLPTWSYQRSSYCWRRIKKETPEEGGQSAGIYSNGLFQLLLFLLPLPSSLCFPIRSEWAVEMVGAVFGKISAFQPQGP